MQKLLFVIGSNRRKSFNRQVADAVRPLLAGKAEIAELDFGDLPFVNQDAEFPVPPAVARVREAVRAADLVWIFTPEYNFSYPGRVKNLIDWLSRPPSAEDRAAPTPLAGKKVALTAIGGRFAAKGCLEKLSELLGFCKAAVLQPVVGLAVDAEAWTTDVVSLSDEQRARLREQVAAVLAP
jgi:NAD(P)H-dependent FMN reductase